MTDLLAGKEVTLPVFNFKTGHREYRQKTVEKWDRMMFLLSREFMD